MATKKTATKDVTKDTKKTAATTKKAAKKTTTKSSASKGGYDKLVIVESPTKATTIKKYLGKGYEVLATMGHVRDLPKSRLGVDVEHNFEPQYMTIRGKGDLIKQLKTAAKNCSKVYLATDPDREGEAISWHLAHILDIDITKKNRVTFNEITKTGVQNGMNNPRSIDLQLVDAQQARRVLDRIVGYELSPFLWKKVRPNLSAGRVQSVTVRMIVDREHEIQNFEPQEYWTIDGMVSKASGTKTEQKPFAVKYYGINGKKAEIKSKAEADEILENLKTAEFTVTGIKKGIRKKTPPPPYITSTLQQEASKRLGFQAKRTMKVAQELYEGVNVDGYGAVGLITYMRTDSLRISDEALAKANELILNKYGDKYALSTPRKFKTNKNAQDGHEAIRPSVIELTPQQIKENLTSDQYKLYKMIWDRFVASQMAEAVYNTVSVDIKADKYNFKASGFTVNFDGYTVLYTDADEEKGTSLPELSENEELKVKEIKGNQHFTQPPPRYTEATLIKELEENGIGRPSTYAPTITTIQLRGYVEREQKVLKPTLLGEITTQLMKEEFADIVDTGFTAGIESYLDKVEEGSVNWKEMIKTFYTAFKENMEIAEEHMEGRDMRIPDEETDIECELCGRKMVIKTGRFGKFLACPGFPECRNTKRIVKETGGICPLCGKKIIQKKSKAGRTYYGCEDNPNCEFMTWDLPISDKCPKCGATLFKTTGKTKRIHCLKEGCGYEILDKNK